MEVQTKRILVGTLKELLVMHRVSDRHVDIKSLEATLKNDSSGAFQIPTVDGLGDLMFNNRELLCRFASLPPLQQLAFIECIRRAMGARQVLEIHIEAEWSSANKRTIKVQQITNGPLVLYGKGPLRFF